MDDWIRRYFVKGANETKFALMGCGSTKETDGDVTPALKLNSLVSKPAEERARAIVKKQNELRRNIQTKFRNNLDGCLRVTMKKILTAKSGDRDEAPNVVFYITDCYLRENEDTHKRYTNELIFVRNTTFMFICVKPKKYEKDNIMSWLRNDTRMVFNYTNKHDLFARLDELLNDYSINKTVWDCKWDKMSETPCKLDDKNACLKNRYPNIVVHPGPEDAVGIYVNSCSVAAPNMTVKCDEAECSTTKAPTVISLEVTTKKTISREVSTKKTIVVTASTKRANGRTSARVVDPGKVEPDKDEGHGGSGVLIGGIIAGLILLLLIVVVVAVVVLRRCKRAKKEIVVKKGAASSELGVERTTAEQEKGTIADIDDRDWKSNKSIEGKQAQSSKGGHSVKLEKETKKISAESSKQGKAADEQSKRGRESKAETKSAKK